MEHRTVLDEFEKHGDKRASLKGRNAKVEASGESTIQGLEQHSSSRAVQVGRKSINQSQAQVDKLQMIEFASPSIEQNMPNATLPTEPETRWKMGKLADENAGLRMELDALQNRNQHL